MNLLHADIVAQRETIPINQNAPTHMRKRRNSKLKCDCALVSMCVITALSNSAYALIAPFLPLELLKMDIPMYMFGYIFSMYSLAVIICSPLVGVLLLRFKRRNFVQFGVFSMCFAMILFGVANYITTIPWFLTLCFITRFIQGFSSSSI